jgi:hypothetical protein
MKATSYLINQAQIVSEVFENEAIIMNLSDGMYYTLSGTAAEVWVLIEANYNLDFIVDKIKSRHSVDTDTLREDVGSLISELLLDSIILPNSSTVDIVEEPERKDFGSYVKPKLNRHTDMAEIMAMDPPLPEINALSKTAQ